MSASGHDQKGAKGMLFNQKGARGMLFIQRIKNVILDKLHREDLNTAEVTISMHIHSILSSSDSSQELI